MPSLLTNRGVSTYGEDGSAAHSFVVEMGLDWEGATVFGPGVIRGMNLPTNFPASFEGGPQIVEFGYEGSSFLAFLFDVMAQHPVDPTLRVIFRGIDRSPPIEHVFEPAEPDDERTLPLHFLDGTLAIVQRGFSEDDAHADLDRDDRIGQPITQREFERTESLLSLLVELSESSDLNDEQQRRVRDLLEFLRDERNETEPEKTPRWKLIGAFRVVGRVLSKLPMPAYGTTRLIMLVNDIGWTRLAAEYQKFFADLL